ncbi:hypothetical protein MVEN_01822700 [Mycena venus]|uniref:Glycosyltransferase family 69 protein n=1 Tax=Mycena venus TaxID=2733690 RepID=A0A8H7CNC4_9AGAR|nr:hypothetical protein MVEN_01822700 [Mycena venus]
MGLQPLHSDGIQRDGLVSPSLRDWLCPLPHLKILTSGTPRQPSMTDRRLLWLATGRLRSSLRHSRNLFALAIFILKIAIRTSTRLVCAFGPALCFVLVFYLCRLMWLDRMAEVWPPAVPVPRIVFVLTLVATPIWGLVMALFYPLRSATFWLWNRLLRSLSRYSNRRREHYWPLQHLSRASVDLGEGSNEIEDRTHRSGVHGYRWWFAAYVGYLSVAVLGMYMLCTYEQPVDHRFKLDVELANSHPRRAGYGTGEKIFIAAMFHNNGDVLPYWINQMTKLIHYLGPASVSISSDNVFVSILESYSWDNSPVLLYAFKLRLEQMGVPHRILIRDTSLVRPESMKTAPPRINFLAASKNLVMQPLVEHGGYERVIFSNDVFVEAESVVELLNTKGGKYDMACGLDLSYWGLYDQWVVRDRLGRIASTLWPYFLEDTGFRAVMADEPAPVFTCWNGIVSIRAEPFLPPHLRTGQLSTSPLSRPLAPTHPSYPQPANLTPATTPPPAFPRIRPRRFNLHDIYVNPRVINSYVWEQYVWWKYITRHWVVKWWIEKVENGHGMHLAKLILGNPENVWQWDGGECHPGW